MAHADPPPTTVTRAVEHMSGDELRASISLDERVLEAICERVADVLEARFAARRLPWTSDAEFDNIHRTR